MCRWFAYVSNKEPCLLEDVLVSPAHALSKQIHEHYLPKLLSHDPSVHAEPTSEAEITVRNRLLNVDGFGVVWYTDTLSTFSPPPPTSASRPNLHPAFYKNIQPPLHDMNFRAICANTSSKVVFAHIRAATATAIVPTNNHPFIFGIHTVMHNGYISDFAKIKRKICEKMSLDAYEHIQGATDTEHFAALLMTHLSPSSKLQSATNPYSKEELESSYPAEWEEYHAVKAMKAALEKTIGTVINVQEELLGSNAQPNDLNIAITDGKNLVACRFRNHPTEQPPSLYFSTEAGVTLNRMFPDHPDGVKGPHGSGKGRSANGKEAAPGAEGHNPHAKKSAYEHGKHVIVASEPTTYKDKEWTLIEKNHCVLVASEDDVVLEELRYPSDGR